MTDPICFLYPGQGAQHIGMGSDLIDAFAIARRRFETAREVLGFPLADMCCHGPLHALNQDLNAQLAVYTISCIVTDILKAEGIHPAAAAGYSSGFYAAAYAAGCFDFGTGLTIVRTAGELLVNNRPCPDAAMGVVFGLSRETVADFCRWVGDVEIAIINTPRQIIISGKRPSIDRVFHKAHAQGALDIYPLPAANAYHSRWMRNNSRRLHDSLPSFRIRAPRLPLYSYSTLETIAGAPQLIRIMADQLHQPVLWVDLIKKLRDNKYNTMVEVGPGTLISRSVRWVDRRIQMLNTASMRQIQRVVQRLSTDGANRTDRVLECAALRWKPCDSIDNRG